MFVFEGIDCCGKTTAINYIKDKLIEKGKTVTVLNDFITCPDLKKKLLESQDPKQQIQIVLEARNKTKQLLSETQGIILYDRYALSTVVYQIIKFPNERSLKPILDPELISLVEENTLPYHLICIRPTQLFEDKRPKFLSKRENNKKDLEDQYWNRKAFWYLTTFGHKHNFKNILGISQTVIHNNGDESFFKELDTCVKTILEEK